MPDIPSLELLRRAADDDEELEDCEIDPDAVAVLVVCIVLGVAVVAVGLYLWKRNQLKKRSPGQTLTWRDYMGNWLDFSGAGGNQEHHDDNASAFGGGSEKGGAWPQQHPGYGSWGAAPPPTGSWTGAPSAQPFNQGSDFGLQQQQAYWGSGYGAGSGYGSQSGSAYGTHQAQSGYGSNQQAYGGSGYGHGAGGYVEGSGFSASSGGSGRSKSKRSRRPEYDDDDASINSYSAYDDSPKRSGSSRSKRKGSTRKHSY